MIIDSRDIEDGASHSTDVCVIGAGAAGLTLVKEFLATGRSVFLMESGGHEPSEKVDDLKKGTLEGEVFKNWPNYLLTERMRFYGGTLNVWEGICLPLQEIDFEEREWMPNCAWPISKKDLDPFYARAAEYIGIRGYDTSIESEVSPKPLKILPEDSEWEGLVYHMTNRPRLRSLFNDEIEASENVKLHLHANATLLHGNENGSKIETVEFQTLEGNRFSVRAHHFVLAAGGIENCRILLNSNRRTGQAIGNEYDNLGRYFFDQLHAAGGRVVIPNPLDDQLIFNRVPSESLGYMKMGGIALKQDAQRKYRISNQSLIFDIAQRSSFRPDDNRIIESCRPLYEEQSVRRKNLNTEEPLEYWFRFKSEMIPDRENRITLGDEKDSLGFERLHARWNLSQEDRRMVRRFSELFCDALGEHFVGRGHLWFSVEGELPGYTMGHGHQLGGTRMHADPRKGVVDGNCAVHGVENLSILGGSVFPSGGNTNPTMTIMALSIRLADQLKKVIS